MLLLGRSGERARVNAARWRHAHLGRIRTSAGGAARPGTLRERAAGGFPAGAVRPTRWGGTPRSLDRRREPELAVCQRKRGAGSGSWWRFPRTGALAGCLWLSDGARDGPGRPCLPSRVLGREGSPLAGARPWTLARVASAGKTFGLQGVACRRPQISDRARGNGGPWEGARPSETRWHEAGSALIRARARSRRGAQGAPQTAVESRGEAKARSCVCATVPSAHS